MKNIITAFATDDGQTFMDRHFGDAESFNIYEINSTKVNFLKTISNTIEEEDEDEDVHADPTKAKGIAGLLKKEKVQVVVSKVFGPNIKRIKKKFVCIITQEKEINDSIQNIQKNMDIIIQEWEKGEARNFINAKIFSKNN